MAFRAALILLALLGTFVLSPQARATRVRALSLETLSKDAAAIAVVRTERQMPRWDSEGRIVTDSEVLVLDAVKGVQTGQRLLVTTLGGSIGELGMRIEGEVPLPLDRRCLVFLRRSSADWRPLGMSQGVLPIEESEGRSYLSPGAAGVSPTRDGSTVPSALILRRPLPMVLRQVRAFLSGER